MARLDRVTDRAAEFLGALESRVAYGRVSNREPAEGQLTGTALATCTPITGTAESAVELGRQTAPSSFVASRVALPCPATSGEGPTND